MKKVAITGGAGYVGSALVPHLINAGYEVTVLDLFWYSQTPFPKYLYSHPMLKIVNGDIRDRSKLEETFAGQDSVIHLACISNDPSFELSPTLGRSINLDSFPLILEVAKISKVKKFIYASSSSVYGVKDHENVTENDSCEPITDYSKYKLACENILAESDLGDMAWSIIRPATVCGYAQRMRLDLSVNILTIQAIMNKKITVHGGQQLRPNLNINDMVRAYQLFLQLPEQKIHQEIFNIGFENMSIMDIAKLVQKTLSFLPIEIVVEPVKDGRSYHINASKAKEELGFAPVFTIRDAIDSICNAHIHKLFKDPLDNPEYYNIKKMKELGLESQV